MNAETMIHIFGLSPYKETALKDILSREIKYVDNDTFKDKDIEKTLFESDIELPACSNWSCYTTMKGGEIVAQGAKILLNAEQQYLAFRQYNYARKRVAELKEALLARPKKSTIEKMLEWNKKAFDIRSLLVELNLRLVVNIINKYSTYHLDIDEMYSDAHLALLNAVDGFDASKSLFSTYAYWSIVHALGKLNKERSRRNDLTPFSVDERGDDAAEFADTKNDGERLFCIEAISKIISDNMANLSEIELNVIKERYLHTNKRPSISEVSKRLQVKAHQVDKNEKSALQKIRAVLQKKF